MIWWGRLSRGLEPRSHGFQGDFQAKERLSADLPLLKHLASFWRLSGAS